MLRKTAQRRGTHQGTVIERKDGLIVVRFWERTPLEQWIKHERYLPRGATRADGEALLEQINAARTLGLQVIYERQPIAAYLPQWLVEIVAPRAKPKTVDTYRFALSHLIPRIGHIALRELTPRHVRALKAELEQALARTSAAFVLTVLKAALSDAMRDELVSRNVASLVRIGAPQPAEVVPLTAAQARAVLDALTNHPLRLFYELAMFRGMRSGEIRGLTWQTIDFERELLMIEHTLYDGNRNGWQLVAPKTPRSRRPIPLSEQLLSSLHARKAQQLADQVRNRTTWKNDLDLVLTDGIGRPVRDYTVCRLYKAACRSVGVPEGRVHDLRHTANSLMAAEGVDDSTRMAILGHATVKINQHYIHTDRERVEQALTGLERRIREA